jgi:hypothetical protein
MTNHHRGAVHDNNYQHWARMAAQTGQTHDRTRPQSSPRHKVLDRKAYICALRQVTPTLGKVAATKK